MLKEKSRAIQDYADKRNAKVDSSPLFEEWVPSNYECNWMLNVINWLVCLVKACYPAVLNSQKYRCYAQSTYCIE